MAHTESIEFFITVDKPNRKPSLSETMYGKEASTEILFSKDLERYSRSKSERPVFTEFFDRILHDLLENSVFEKRRADWFDELPKVIEKLENSIHSS